MPSIRSTVFLWLLRHRHLFKLKLKPEVVDESFSVEEFRASVDRATRKRKIPEGISVHEDRIGEMRAEWIGPEKPVDGKVLLYIHGGGFISGSCDSHRTFVAQYALGTNLTCLLFDYRVAPEHPFPAAVDDCVTAYEWLLEQGYAPRDIILGGESAGGTLTLSLLHALKERGIDLPKAVFSISPVTDLRCGADSFSYNAKKDLAPEGSSELWTGMYIADNDPTHPLLSPLMGDFTGAPPLHITVGTHELHFDDCVNVAAKAEQQGVNVTLRSWPRMVHAFPMMAPLFPEATRALEDICGFVRGHCDVPSTEE